MSNVQFIQNAHFLCIITGHSYSTRVKCCALYDLQLMAHHPSESRPTTEQKKQEQSEIYNITSLSAEN